MGIDTASIDFGQSRGFETHIALLRAGIPALENLAGLEELPDGEFTVVALPMKIRRIFPHRCHRNRAITH
ncbi:MAG: hypothetical protein ACREXU_07730 [Gammaproteobacteria bacterium]